MAQQIATFTIVGSVPLLMKNGESSDPMNHFAKQMKTITVKSGKKRTEADQEELARIEWHSGLYTNDEGQLILPDFVIEAALVNGAKKSRLGSTFKSAIFVEQHAVLDIGVKVPKDLGDLYKEGPKYVFRKPARVGDKMVPRTRPIFRNWKATFSVAFDDEQINYAQLEQAVRDTGNLVGVGDWRPRHGRFTVEKAVLA
jgi:hypothetical protein